MSLEATESAERADASTVDTPLAPITAARRIDAMDILRGFALIGILLMNIEWFNRPIAELPRFDHALTGFDHAASFLVMLLVQGKFYKLFSLLFGMGFAIMLSRAQERGQPFTAVFLRRMLALWLIGVAHLVFFWGGDILHDYAVGGLLLLGWVGLWNRGRMKRFAKIGGEMVSLAVVENCATAVWPDNMHAAAILPDDKKGEQIVLVTDKQSPDRAKLLGWAQNHGVPELAVPKKIVSVPEVPVLGTGKLDYVAIQRLAADGVGLTDSQKREREIRLGEIDAKLAGRTGDAEQDDEPVKRAAE